MGIEQYVGLEWMKDASCKDMGSETFFPVDDGRTLTLKLATEAFKICHDCPVRLSCLEFALQNNEKFGIWGGLTSQERISLKRRRDRSRARLS